MTRPWSEISLAFAYTGAAANVPLGAIAEALNRSPSEVDLALWAMVGRSPAQALARLGGRPGDLRAQLLRWLSGSSAELGELARLTGAHPDHVEAELRDLALEGLADAVAPPQPAGREAMRWFLTQAAAS
jgi:hypothetical protein